MKHLLLAAALALSSAAPVLAAGFVVVSSPLDGDDPLRRPPIGIQPPPVPRPPIQPRPPIPPPRPYPFAPLEITSHKVSARIADQLATTTVEQVFYNPNPQALEGSFMFPVPKGAHLSKFTLDIDGKKAEAELLDAAKARGIFEDIVRSMRDPALLEYAGRDLFRVRVFPIGPHASRRVTLTWTQLLRSDSGLAAYTCPLAADKFSSKPLKSVSLKLELETSRPLKALYSPTHKLDVKREARRATVGFEAANERPEADFQLFFSQESADVGLSLLAHRVGGGEGHFVLFASPGLDAKDRKPQPKDVVFVLDTSGSMAGGKLEQAKKALHFCVENLNENDRFEVLRFSTEAEPAFDKLVDAGPANRKRATDFIKELKPLGSTAIDDALRKALALFPARGAGAARPATIIFLTDGKPTIGTTDEEQIVRNVREQNAAGTRVFCFGIGTDVNTHLLDRITELTKAYSQYVLPEEDLEVKLSAFFSKIKEPALSNVKVTFPDGVRVTRTYPNPLPDLFRGDQLVLAGRYAGAGKGRVVVEGTMAGEPRRFEAEVQFPESQGEHDFIPRLWAMRRVGFLLDEIRLRGENKELKDEVTELARQYSIVTPYTAYLIVEDEARRNVPEARRTMLQLERDREAGRQAHWYYESLREKDGDAGVGGARLSLAAKQADAPEQAVRLGAEVAKRAYGVAPSTSAPRGAVGGTPALVVSSPVADASERVVRYSQQNRFVAGKSFFQNGDAWVDSDLQKVSAANRAQVKFGSPEYFKLLATVPQAARWLSLGRSVQFAHAGVIYEVTE